MAVINDYESYMTVETYMSILLHSCRDPFDSHNIVVPITLPLRVSVRDAENHVA